MFEFFLLSVQVRKYVSYGFPITIFCNPGVHYEKSCTCLCNESYLMKDSKRDLVLQKQDGGNK